jgi:hypothetical protein
MKYILIICLSSIIYKAYSQASVDGGKLNINTSRLGSIESIPLVEKSKVKSQMYLEDKFHNGFLIFGRSKKIEGLPFRNDIKNNFFEFKVNQNVKYLDGYGITTFTFNCSDSIKREFIRADKFSEDTKKFTGYFESLIKGNYTLVIYYYNVILPANYVLGLDVGERTESNIIRTKYLLLNPERGVFEIGKKSDLLNYFEDRERLLLTFIQKKKIP